MHKFLLLTVAMIFTCLVSSQAQSLYTDATSNLQSTALGASSMDVKTADINGDGHKDIIVAIEFGQNRILFGDGTGKYVDQSDGRFKKANHDSEDIGIADFDGNGSADIIIVSEDDSVHELYLNNMGTFTDVSNRLSKSKANAVLVTDVNGDTYVDILIGNNGQNQILINDGTANFTDETNIRMPTILDVTQDLLLVDVDNDMDDDLIVGNEDTNRILINDGTGRFTDVTNTNFPTGLNVETRKLATADINSDGYADLYFANVEFIPGKNRQDRIFINDKTGKFVDETTTRLPVDPRHTPDAIFNDVDMDGDLDIMATHFPSSVPQILLNDGTGKFSYKNGLYPFGTTIQGVTVLATDLNSDGLIDVYFGGFQNNDKMLFRRLFPQNVNELSKKKLLTVYQNTTFGSIVVKNNVEQSHMVSVHVFSVDGRLVANYKNIAINKVGQISLDVEGFSAGIYIARVTGDGIEISKKIIIR